MKQLFIALSKAFLSVFERINLLASPARAFYDTRDFQWVQELEQNYTQILEEYRHFNTAAIPFMDDVSNFQKQIVAPTQWRSLFLVCYGRDIPANVRHFPETKRLLQSIPGLQTAFFSVFEPGTTLLPHRGPFNGVLRYHLGLIVPDDPEKCRIIVGGESRNWAAGQSLIFDDTFEHEAYNLTDSRRVVLFVDFLRPLPAPFSWLNRLIVFLIGRSPFVNEIIQKG